MNTGKVVKFIIVAWILLYILLCLIACSEDNPKPKVKTLTYNEAIHEIEQNGGRLKPITFFYEPPFYKMVLYNGREYYISESTRNMLCVALKLKC